MARFRTSSSSTTHEKNLWKEGRDVRSVLYHGHAYLSKFFFHWTASVDIQPVVDRHRKQSIKRKARVFQRHISVVRLILDLKGKQFMMQWYWGKSAAVAQHRNTLAKALSGSDAENKADCYEFPELRKEMSVNCFHDALEQIQSFSRKPYHWWQAACKIHSKYDADVKQYKYKKVFP